MDKLLVFMLIVATLVGCQGIIPKENIPQVEQLELTIQVGDIENYLAANICEASFGGNVFCAYDVLATEQEGDITTLYLRALCLEYYQEQQSLDKGTGISVPVAVILHNRDSSLWVSEHRIPGDGIDYGKDVKVIFPQSIWPEIIPSNSDEIEDYNLRAETLENEIKEMGQIYFETSD